MVFIFIIQQKSGASTAVLAKKQKKRIKYEQKSLIEPHCNINHYLCMTVLKSKKLSDFIQCVFNIFNNIIRVFNTNRKPD